MSPSSWKPEYSVHITTFDTQHQKLLAMIEKIQESAKTGVSPDSMARLFDDLIEYTRFHFQSEEKAMHQHGFPGFAAHQLEHQDLIRKAMDYHRKFIDGKTMISVEIMRYLNDWLLHHIDTVDRQYDQYFNEKGVT